MKTNGYQPPIFINRPVVLISEWESLSPAERIRRYNPSGRCPGDPPGVRDITHPPKTIRKPPGVIEASHAPTTTRCLAPGKYRHRTLSLQFDTQEHHTSRAKPPRRFSFDSERSESDHEAVKIETGVNLADVEQAHAVSVRRAGVAAWPVIRRLSTLRSKLATHARTVSTATARSEAAMSRAHTLQDFPPLTNNIDFASMRRSTPRRLISLRRTLSDMFK